VLAMAEERNNPSVQGKWIHVFRNDQRVRDELYL
jgi:hypothetical protein